MHEQLRKRLQTVPSNRQRLSRSDFTTTNGTAKERSKVAQFQAERPLAIREDRIRLALVAHETFTTDGNAGNAETFALSNDLIDAGSTSESLALFKEGTAVDPDSVDYSNDQFDYTDSGTNNDLDVYYSVGPGNQSRVEIEKAAPKSTQDVLWSGDVGLLNARDQDRSGIEMDFSHPLDAVVPENWYIRVYVGSPYRVEWDESINSTSAPNAILSVPIRRSRDAIQGLSRAVRHRIAEK